VVQCDLESSLVLLRSPTLEVGMRANVANFSQVNRLLGLRSNI
jgi:hypothetical protein